MSTLCLPAALLLLDCYPRTNIPLLIYYRCIAIAVLSMEEKNLEEFGGDGVDEFFGDGVEDEEEGNKPSTMADRCGCPTFKFERC